MSRRFVAGVMARAPVPGRCKTRLAAGIGASAAAELYAALLADTLSSLARVPSLEVVLMAAPEDDGARRLRELVAPGIEVHEQDGATLETRVQHALTHLSRGAAAVVLTGSDSPIPPTAELAAALEWLGGPRRALIAPTVDGGYWCIGLSSPPALDVVTDIPWSTSAVAAVTRERCAASGVELRELPRTFDVDEPGDLEVLRAALAAAESAAPHTRAALSRLDLL